MMKNFLICLLVCVCSTISVEAETITRGVWHPIERAEYVVLGCRPTGMFALFLDVISLLQHYEMGYFQGIKVDFKNEGDYYDQNHGSNWWEYYFEPIVLGNQNPSTITEYCHFYCREIPELYNPKEYNNYLINKYIRIKPHIQTKVDLFSREKFAGNFVIGVHYRGTDKQSEAPRVRYEEVERAIRAQMFMLGGRNCRIFAASDESAFLSFLQRQFLGMVYSYDVMDKHRGNYISGEKALIDCLLLSKTDFLIRTSSNLSLVSTFFNPTMPVIELNQRLSPPCWDCIHDPYTGEIIGPPQMKTLHERLNYYIGSRESLIQKSMHNETQLCRNP